MGKLIGALPGRLSVLALVFSALFATMSGSSVATTSLMGTLLLPEMERHGYKSPMSIGPIVGAGGLAILIPPSSLAILVGALGQVSISQMLIGAAVPGLMLMVLYGTYIIVRAYLHPELAPNVESEPYPFSQKVKDFFLYVAPMSLVIVLVLALIFVGVATPTESAVLGIIGALILAALYGTLSRAAMREAIVTSLRLSVMLLFILITSITFSQVLAFSGATRGLAELAIAAVNRSGPHAPGPPRPGGGRPLPGRVDQRAARPLASCNASHPRQDRDRDRPLPEPRRSDVPASRG